MGIIKLKNFMLNVVNKFEAKFGKFGRGQELVLGLWVLDSKEVLSADGP